MKCVRCKTETTGKHGWCPACDREFDAWSRRHASDIIYSVLGAMVVVLTISLGLPLLGAPTVIATAGIFGGFGALLGIQRLSRNRRRRQFLSGAGIPRAYLPDRT